MAPSKVTFTNLQDAFNYAAQQEVGTFFKLQKKTSLLFVGNSNDSTYWYPISSSRRERPTSLQTSILTFKDLHVSLHVARFLTTENHSTYEFFKKQYCSVWTFKYKGEEIKMFFTKPHEDECPGLVTLRFDDQLRVVNPSQITEEVLAIQEEDRLRASRLAAQSSSQPRFAPPLPPSTERDRSPPSTNLPGPSNVSPTTAARDARSPNSSSHIIQFESDSDRESNGESPPPYNPGTRIGPGHLTPPHTSNGYHPDLQFHSPLSEDNGNLPRDIVDNPSTPIPPATSGPSTSTEAASSTANIPPASQLVRPTFDSEEEALDWLNYLIGLPTTEIESFLTDPTPDEPIPADTFLLPKVVDLSKLFAQLDSIRNARERQANMILNQTFPVIPRVSPITVPALHKGDPVALTEKLNNIFRLAALSASKALVHHSDDTETAIILEINEKIGAGAPWTASECRAIAKKRLARRKNLHPFVAHLDRGSPPIFYDPPEPDATSIRPHAATTATRHNTTNGERDRSTHTDPTTDNLPAVFHARCVANFHQNFESTPLVRRDEIVAVIIEDPTSEGWSRIRRLQLNKKGRFTEGWVPTTWLIRVQSRPITHPDSTDSSASAPTRAPPAPPGQGKGPAKGILQHKKGNKSAGSHTNQRPQQQQPPQQQQQQQPFPRNSRNRGRGNNSRDRSGRRSRSGSRNSSQNRSVSFDFSAQSGRSGSRGRRGGSQSGPSNDQRNRSSTQNSNSNNNQLFEDFQRFQQFQLWQQQLHQPQQQQRGRQQQQQQQQQQQRQQQQQQQRQQQQQQQQQQQNFPDSTQQPRNNSRSRRGRRNNSNSRQQQGNGQGPLGAAASGNAVTVPLRFVPINGAQQQRRKRN